MFQCFPMFSTSIQLFPIQISIQIDNTKYIIKNHLKNALNQIKSLNTLKNY